MKISRANIAGIHGEIKAGLRVTSIQHTPSPMHVHIDACHTCTRAHVHTYVRSCPRAHIIDQERTRKRTTLSSLTGNVASNCLLRGNTSRHARTSYFDAGAPWPATPSDPVPLGPLSFMSSANSSAARNAQQPKKHHISVTIMFEVPCLRCHNNFVWKNTPAHTGSQPEARPRQNMRRKHSPSWVMCLTNFFISCARRQSMVNNTRPTNSKPKNSRLNVEKQIKK